MKVRTNRPVLYAGQIRTEFDTTEQHARELEARGLIEPAGGDESPVAKSKAAPQKGKPKNGN
ncbi:hypothetical protein [Paraburkholderia xenovorans]|uniref:hypothetical protein n=1 Tax=Paraburkholderia xenovorans TaxID=36873 RepID=UPI0015C56233|nr:hypothetical protein [Paraburkholderia xenovorans]NPT36247.1 hypothetical protein [Paraburkholderia xenovorans]